MDPVTTATRSLAGHDDLRETEAGYRYDQTPFTVVASVEEAAVVIRITVPSLTAVVVDQVGDAVASGWYDSFRRRVGDVDRALTVDETAVVTETEHTGETVTVTYRRSLTAPDRAGADVAAAAQFVEGTYLQGVIPGYEYTDPVRSMLQQASAAAGSEDLDSTRGGTPL